MKNLLVYCCLISAILIVIVSDRTDCSVRCATDGEFKAFRAYQGSRGLIPGCCSSSRATRDLRVFKLMGVSWADCELVRAFWAIVDLLIMVIVRVYWNLYSDIWVWIGNWRAVVLKFSYLKGPNPTNSIIHLLMRVFLLFCCF